MLHMPRVEWISDSLQKLWSLDPPVMRPRCKNVCDMWMQIIEDDIKAIRHHKEDKTLAVW
jgi:hypothetical protein